MRALEASGGRDKARSEGSAWQLLLGKQKCEGEAAAPLRFAFARGGGVAQAARKIDRLAVQVEQTAQGQIERHGQALTLPVIAAFGIEVDIGGVGPGVAEKGLEEG